MIPIIALAAVALLFMLFLAYQVWWQSGDDKGIENSPPVDLDAFRNLTDPEEARFLRNNLSPKTFRRIQRIRLRVAAMYVSAISKNAAQLIVVGRSARAHPNAEIAAVGLDVFHRALQLKLRCSLSLLRLNANILWPTLLSPSTRIAEQYLDVTSLTASLPKELAA
ncbi:MAG: hypothetical protein WA718_12950 [Terriglobales bacterium]